MSGLIYDHLKNIYFAQREGRPLIYQHIGQTAKRELQFLMDNGYIRRVKLDELEIGDDLAQKIKSTHYATVEMEDSIWIRGCHG